MRELKEMIVKSLMESYDVSYDYALGAVEKATITVNGDIIEATYPSGVKPDRWRVILTEKLILQS
jgi:hypothetical protein